MPYEVETSVSLNVWPMQCNTAMYGRPNGSPCGDVCIILTVSRCCEVISVQSALLLWQLNITEKLTCMYSSIIFFSIEIENTPVPVSFPLRLRTHKVPLSTKKYPIIDTIQTCTRVICKVKGKNRRNDAGTPSKQLQLYRTW